MNKKHISSSSSCVTTEYLEPIVSGNQIVQELRLRKNKDIFKSVSASNKKLVAEKVSIEERDGWRVDKRNIKSTRMAKEKPSDEQLEDEFWCILAQMGFREMSKGRQFKITVDNDLSPRQIDVFAKDDESVIVAECTQRGIPSKKKMESLINKIKTLRRGVIQSISKAYGRDDKLKVGFIIVTRNIRWSNADLDKCKLADITVITESELDYYSELVKHLKSAARYQFLGHIFGGQKITGLKRTVVATRGSMGGDTFYSFLISPDELLKIAYVGHKASRDTDNLDTYQRMLKPSRLKNIARYINKGGKFPTNIVVNIKTNKNAPLRFDRKNNVGEGTFGELHLPSSYASAWVIDGQHRLYGYAYARNTSEINSDSTVLSVLAYENLKSEKEMDLFIDINSKQVKVSTGLLVELYSDLHWDSADSDEAFQALLSRIASKLNSSSHTSPLCDRMVVTGKRKTKHRCLTQTSIRDGLKHAKLMGTSVKGNILPGPLSTDDIKAYSANLHKGQSVISNCLMLFKDGMKEHWEIGDGPGGYLCTNNGIRAIFLVIKDVADYIRQKYGIYLYLLDADETFALIQPCLNILVAFFKNASDQEIFTIRNTGSSLKDVQRQAYRMEEQIHKQFSDFNPAGLQEYLSSRDEEGTKKANEIIINIQERLSAYVIATLKNKYGTHKKRWWVEGVPTKIRSDCSSRWEQKNREGNEEGQLYLQNYVDICIQNWDILKDVISLDANDKQATTANVKWIKSLKDIHDIVKHEERGPLDKEQTAFLRNLAEKVDKYFPSGESQ